MTLLCTLKSGEKQSTTIIFSPPLAGYEAVKPRLLEMKAIAQENLGMIRAPHITSFEFPLPEGYWLLAAIGALSFLTFYPETSLTNPVTNMLGRSSIQRAFQITVVIHALESLYTLSLCRRHKTGFVNGVSCLQFFRCTTERLTRMLDSVWPQYASIRLLHVGPSAEAYPESEN